MTDNVSEYGMMSNNSNVQNTDIDSMEIVGGSAKKTTTKKTVSTKKASVFANKTKNTKTGGGTSDGTAPSTKTSSTGKKSESKVDATKDITKKKVVKSPTTTTTGDVKATKPLDKSTVHANAAINDTIAAQMVQLHSMLGHLIKSGITKKLTSAHLNYLMSVERSKFYPDPSTSVTKVGGSAGQGSTTLPMAWFDQDHIEASRYFSLEEVEAKETNMTPTDDVVRPAIVAHGGWDWSSLDPRKIWSGVQEKLGRLSMSNDANARLEKTADQYARQLVQNAAIGGKGISASAIRSAAARMQRHGGTKKRN